MIMREGESPVEATKSSHEQLSPRSLYRSMISQEVLLSVDRVNFNASLGTTSEGVEPIDVQEQNVLREKMLDMFAYPIQDLLIEALSEAERAEFVTFLKTEPRPTAFLSWFIERQVHTRVEQEQVDQKLLELVDQVKQLLVDGVALEELP